MAEAKCPGTCGELLQGWMSGSEKLISCPIDIYSYISVEHGIQRQPLMPLIEQAIAVTLEFLQIESRFRDSLNIEHSSQLPIGKGYASSTADISATIVALCRHLKQPISQAHIAKLAARLEPSDGVMFEGLALVDHTKGEMAKSYSLSCSPAVLILEPTNTLLTRDFHRLKCQRQLEESSAQLLSALDLFEQGVVDNNIQMIGQASTISAVEHQKIYTTPYFSGILSCVERCDWFGLSLAHSGSIIGLLYDDTQHDIALMLSNLKSMGIFDVYQTQRQVKIVSGGVI